VPDADLPASIESVDTMLGEAPAGLDSHILLRRPDVVQAEYQLRAANAEIGAARAAFFPTISLTGVIGFASPQLKSLFNSGSFAWSAAGGASETLFAGGANVANLALARAEMDEAVAVYQKAIQTAFQEVSDALAQRGTITDQLNAQTALVDHSADNYMLADARYREGVDTFLNSLDAQRTLYSARRSLASTRLLRATNLVALYQSLGGDQLLDTVPAHVSGIPIR
jgi:multidrug efflux system outer membrane protein